MHAKDDFKSYSQIVIHYGKTQPESIACIFQTRGPETAIKITYAELSGRALARAEQLILQGFKGKTAALIFATGIDFVVDFLACLHAGVIAVPLNFSRNQQQFSRALGVLSDAKVSAILTTDDVVGYIRESIDSAKLNQADYQWLSSPDIAQPPPYNPSTSIKPDDIAFIQYTSGSTSDPKGVVVSQSNIIYNQQAIQLACSHEQGLIAGGWLPQFHDMGLIGHMMQPLYLGGTYVFMPPMNFIQRPRRWLELISDYRIASSAAPNFGFEHSVKCISDREDLSHIDLSCWKVALNGSEPINAKTMDKFSERFGHLGFDADAFFPCYGMAETTLFVSGGLGGSKSKYQKVDRQSFLQGVINPSAEGITVVNCGQISPQFKLKIVNPHTQLRCQNNEIGEIWLIGKSVAQGYWQNKKSTQKTFYAQVVGEPSVNYLRTGDLGFVSNGSLFVTGRIKELIILRGKNIYPYDLERTCCEHELSAGTAAVFSVGNDDDSSLAALVEVKKNAFADIDHDKFITEINEKIGDQHQLRIDTIVPVKPGTIPKTTSGKIQRTRCRKIIETYFQTAK